MADGEVKVEVDEEIISNVPNIDAQPTISIRINME